MVRYLIGIKFALQMGNMGEELWANGVDFLLLQAGELTPALFACA